jgi:hypothetical protein
MSSLQSQRQAGAASGLDSVTVSVASSGFLQDYGNYVGGTFSILWTGLAIYASYIIFKMDTTKVPNKKYYLVIPSILILFVLMANGYYWTYRNNDNEEEQKTGRSRYANITLIPIYLSLISIGIGVMINQR